MARSQKDKWIEMVKKLQSYRQEHNGSCIVPAKYPPDQKLGTWVKNQRQLHRKNLLAKDRFDQLNKMGFDWTSKRDLAFQDQWANMIQRLKVYQKDNNGGSIVPKGYDKDPQLGSWVTKQRHWYKKGSLSQGRFEQLDAIGFEWTVTTFNKTPKRVQNNEDKWTNMHKRLDAYQQEHDGSCDVPQGYRPDPSLGSWVNRQRQNYNKGLLTQERIDKLDAIGFQWVPSFEDKWTDMFKRLQAYQEEHDGRTDVPRQYLQDPQLGDWALKQRRYRSQGLLIKERCDRLDAIGFEWTRNTANTPNTGNPSQDQKWTKMLKRLRAYQQERDGRSNEPKKNRRIKLPLRSK